MSKLESNDTIRAGGFFERKPVRENNMKGCFTALITPFTDSTIDYEGLDRLVEYQIRNGISGILVAGTTGESPTLTWEEHHRLTKRVVGAARGHVLCIAGTGSNNTLEALEATRQAADAGVEAVLLVDPYYNGPSSLEIRREYVSPVAEANPDVQIIPYIIPGRTGAQLMPEDLALLCRRYKNVNTVKEATGNIDNMRRTRACCGADFSIISGDDGMTLQMMTDPDVRASGVISVYSNLLPGAVSEMVRLLCAGETEGARALADDLSPLFDLVTVKTIEETPLGQVVCKAKNPLAIKTLMSVLGMPAGKCRRPLGKLTRKGIDTLVLAARKVFDKRPRLFQPLADFFEVDVEARLSDPKFREGLFYTEY
jgi:4-hydroxy-tetrahydrodipicolinate synthase